VEGLLRINVPGFAPYGGFNYNRPKTDRAEFGITSSAFGYAEARLFDDCMDALGEETGFDALTIGIRYGVSFKSFHRRY
jgi:hypothetical protein